ncbi:hypothetical protein PRIPAC_79613 [Pristionchus pacificus]|nr:hypothetical protein PRIPAC_79613 [Pristionchus pacificus]
MIVVFLLIGMVLLFLFYRHHNKRTRHWSDRRVPGPKPEFLLGNLRAFWTAGKARAVLLKEWTEQYGKVYGYLEGQQQIRVISDVPLVSEIFIKRFDYFHAPAKIGLQGADNSDHIHMAQARGAQWKRLRTLSTDAFSVKAIRNVFPTIKDSARQIVKFIEKKEGEEIDAQRYFREYTMDIISKITLGMDDCQMFENEMVGWCSEFFSAPRNSWIFVLAAVFPSMVQHMKILFFVLFLFGDIPIVKLSKHIQKVVVDRKRSRDAGETTRSDILEMFLDAESEDVEVIGGKAKNKLTTNEIVANCKLFLLAGFDTTSITISKAVHFLANHEEIQQRLRDEIDDVIGHENYDFEEIGSLRYAEAVIKETLRHHPIASGFTTRECTSDCQIGEHSFREGDMVIVDSLSLQMDKEVWGEDAEEFRPERWLENTTRDRAAFLAFGEGPRICLGMKMAFVEAKIALVEVLRNFTIEKTKNTNPLKLVGSFLLSFEVVPVSLKKR